MPDQRALVSFQPDGIVQVDLVSKTDPKAVSTGRGEWQSSDGGRVECSYFVLFEDPTSQDVMVVTISDSGDIDSDGLYSGDLEVEVTTESGSSTSTTGTSTGRRLST